MKPSEAWAALVERGCLCGTDRPQDCPLHSGLGDNRGIAAFFKAGMPLAFPTVAYCSRVLTRDADGRALTSCGAQGLMYPDVELCDPSRKDEGPPKHRPTLICPRCSTPAAERALVTEVEAAGRDKLNKRRVFV